MRELADGLRPRRRARRPAAAAQAHPRADAPGQGRARRGRAPRAARTAAPGRGVRPPGERVPREARRPRRRAEPPLARGPAGDDRLPERPGEPLPPGRLPAPHRRAAAEARASTSSSTRPTARPSSSAGRASTGRTARSTRRSRAAPARWRTTRRSRCTRARASYYVHFPRLEPGDVVELQYRVEDVAPRNAFADYFGEVVYMQSGEPIARARVRPHDAEEPHLLLQRPQACPGLTEDRGGQGRPAHLPLRRHDVPGRATGAAAAAVDRGARPRARLDVQVVGRRWAAGTGASSRTSSSPTTRCAGAPQS